MAFIKSASPESIKGEWVVIGKDPDTGNEVKFRIRPIPEPTLRKILASYGEVREAQRGFQDKDGRRVFGAMMKSRVYDPEEDRKAFRDQALYAWTGSEGLSINLLDEKQAKVYAAMLGLDSLEVGVDVSLDDRLNDEVKRYILDNEPELTAQIVAEAFKAKERERDLRGNS